MLTLESKGRQHIYAYVLTAAHWHEVFGDKYGGSRGSWRRLL